MEPGWRDLVFNAYGLALILGGLGSLGWIAWNLRKWQAIRRAPGPWQLGWLDFLIFAFLVVTVSLVSGEIGRLIALLITPPAEGEVGPPIAVVAAFSSLVMQLSLIALFWQWRQLHRRDDEGPLNTRNPGWGGVARAGIAGVLGAYPVILGVALGWQQILTLLQSYGLPISMDEQLAVELFRETEQRWVLGILGFAAIILAPIGEELVFRAGLYRFLLGHMPKAVAMILAGSIFGFMHLNVVGFAPLAVFGCLLCLAYDLTGNLKVPIVMHMLFNANQVLMLLLFPEQIG